MPEGPSIIILKELTKDFVGKEIQSVEGNSKIDLSRLPGAIIKSIRSWGKHFLIELPSVSLRVHFLMFGSYRINERKDTVPRLSLRFADSTELNFYACSVKYVESRLDGEYDWQADVMSDQWNPALAREKLRKLPYMFACDALLNQDIFSGVGNIIKNEVLFRIRVHPLSLVGALPPAKLKALIEQARIYSFEFLEWKKAYVLRQHWQAHNKSVCPRCDLTFTRAHLGNTHRRSFYCENCQKKYEVIM